MKLSAGMIFILLIMAGVTLAGGRQIRVVDILQSPSTTLLAPTPLSAKVQSTPQPTATIDPASIGDTSGVIAIGLIVVFIILVGVLWGSYELRMEIRKTKSPKE